jgi:hypothetical protein
VIAQSPIIGIAAMLNAAQIVATPKVSIVCIQNRHPWISADFFRKIAVRGCDAVDRGTESKHELNKFGGKRVFMGTLHSVWHAKNGSGHSLDLLRLTTSRSSQADIELRSIMWQRKRRLHETGPLSPRDVENFSSIPVKSQGKLKRRRRKNRE